MTKKNQKKKEEEKESKGVSECKDKEAISEAENPTEGTMSLLILEEPTLWMSLLI